MSSEAFFFFFPNPAFDLLFYQCFSPQFNSIQASYVSASWQALCIQHLPLSCLTLQSLCLQTLCLVIFHSHGLIQSIALLLSNSAEVHVSLTQGEFTPRASTVDNKQLGLYLEAFFYGLNI